MKRYHSTTTIPILDTNFIACGLVDGDSVTLNTVQVVDASAPAHTCDVSLETIRKLYVKDTFGDFISLEDKLIQAVAADVSDIELAA